MSELHYAVSVSATLAQEDGKVSIHSPTFYLHADVQGIVGDTMAEREDHARRIVIDWFSKVCPGEIYVAVAETAVSVPDHQANALLRAVKNSQTRCSTVTYQPDSKDINLHVREANVPSDRHAFECGIALDGRTSS